MALMFEQRPLGEHTGREAEERLAEIRRYSEMSKASGMWPTSFYTKLAKQHEFLLSLVDTLQGRLDTAEGQLAKWREIHKPERRYTTPDDFEGSFDDPQWIVEAFDITIEQVKFFEVCAHCGSLEVRNPELGGRGDYRESLWPCNDAEAAGLGEGDGQ